MRSEPLELDRKLPYDRFIHATRKAPDSEGPTPGPNTVLQCGKRLSAHGQPSSSKKEKTNYLAGAAKMACGGGLDVR